MSWQVLVSSRLLISRGKLNFIFTGLERPTESAPDLRQVFADFGAHCASNGFTSWLFAASAPVAIILAVGSHGGLSENEIASWIFGVFFVNGLLTVLFCWLYRQPLIMLWTIPGAVLVGHSLNHLTFPEVVGAYYGTSTLLLLLGATGWIKRAMLLVPKPIVMGMVAGVFLRFGLNLVQAVFADFAIAGPMVVIWLLLTTSPRLGRGCPPIIGTLLVGALLTVVLGRFDSSTPPKRRSTHT